MSERVQKEIAALKKKTGRKPGYKHDARTIEKIRASINGKLCVDTLHDLAQNGGQHDGVRATAALGLLQFIVPKLSATDITSEGESIVVERVTFKPTTERK
jgi:hypothetical protein